MNSKSCRWMLMTFLDCRPSDNERRWWRFELYECFLACTAIKVKSSQLSQVKVKVKMPYYSEWSLGGVLISLSQAIEPVGGYTMHCVCDAWPVRRMTYGYLPSQWPVQIYTAWWTEAHYMWTTCLQSRYVKRSGSRLQVRRPNHHPTTPNLVK